MPDSRGPLSSRILPSTIAAANTEVMRVINDSSKLKSAGKKRGAYNKYTPEFKANVARYAIENGNCQAAIKFSTTGKVIDKSTVRGWVTTYKREMERKRKAGEEVSDVTLLPEAKRMADSIVTVVIPLKLCAKCHSREIFRLFGIVNF